MPTSSNYLCGCGRFMRVKRNSVTVEEQLEDGAPYKLWDADLLECPECGAEIIAGFGQRPIAEHWQPTYAEQRARLVPIYPGRCRENGAEAPHAFVAAVNEPTRVRYGDEDLAHCAQCGQVEDRPIHHIGSAR